MARWTASVSDVRHISKIASQMPMGGLVVLFLKSKTIVEGVMVRANIGNNGGAGGWKYYGEVEILLKDGTRGVADYLDIENAMNGWTAEKAKEYEALGLIQIVEYPESK